MLVGGPIRVKSETHAGTEKNSATTCLTTCSPLFEYQVILPPRLCQAPRSSGPENLTVRCCFGATNCSRRKILSSRNGFGFQPLTRDLRKADFPVLFCPTMKFSVDPNLTSPESRILASLRSLTVEMNIGGSLVVALHCFYPCLRFGRNGHDFVFATCHRSFS